MSCNFALDETEKPHVTVRVSLNNMEPFFRYSVTTSSVLDLFCINDEQQRAMIHVGDTANGASPGKGNTLTLKKRITAWHNNTSSFPRFKIHLAVSGHARECIS
jgi:hypothetical protein